MKYKKLIIIFSLILAVIIPLSLAYADTSVNWLERVVKSGETITLPQNIPEKAGYEFLGYKLEGDTSGKIYKAGETVKITSNMNFVAEWQEKPVPTIKANCYWHTSGTVIYTYRGKITTINIVDSYSDPYTYSQDISANADGSVMGYLVLQGDGNYTLIIAGNGSGYIKANADSQYMFNNYSSSTGAFSALKTITGLELLDTSAVTDTYRMFYGCTGLTELTGLERWDTSSLTDISSMFQNCTGLTALDLSGWDTSSVIYTIYTFSNCTSLQVVYVKDEATKILIENSSSFPTQAKVEIKA